MQYRHLISLAPLLILLGTTKVIGVTPDDPFAPNGDNPTRALLAEVAAAKPLTLEVCYGEVTEPLPTAPNQNAQSPNGSPNLTAVITDAFLKQAKRLQVAVADKDLGQANIPGQAELTFQLNPQDNAHSLQFILDVLHAGGRSQINNNVTLITNGQWMTFGGLTRTEVTRTTTGEETTTKKNLIIAIRLTSH